MATYYKVGLSGVTNGLPIIASGATLGEETAVCTAHSGTSDWDEIYLWGTNPHTSAVSVIVYFGAITAPIYATIPSQDVPYNIIPGWPLNGGKGVSVISGYAYDGASPQISGYINRILN